ncbi:unnamed protein product, partial [Effrenium voratum]
MKRPLTAFMSESDRKKEKPERTPKRVVLTGRAKQAPRSTLPPPPAPPVQAQSSAPSRQRREAKPKPKTLAKAQAARRVFTGEASEEEKPLQVKRLSSTAPPPPPPFDEAGEEAARKHCVFFHNAPLRISEAHLKKFFERAGTVRRLRIFQENGRSRGMGLCEYVSPEGALA